MRLCKFRFLGVAVASRKGTSELGNASGHLTTNLPIVLAGGDFKHGQHLAFDKTNNMPLPNLFVSMLQGLGMEVDKFASSTGTLTGLT